MKKATSSIIAMLMVASISCYDYDYLATETIEDIQESVQPMYQQVGYKIVKTRATQIQACNNIKDPAVRKMCLSRIK